MEERGSEVRGSVRLRGSGFLLLSRRGHAADLLHEVEGVISYPLFLNLAAGDTIDEDARYGRLIAGRSVAQKLALVGAVSCPASNHPVAFGYQILDRNLQIRQTATVAAHKTLKALQATHLSLSAHGTVADEVGSEQLVD